MDNGQVWCQLGAVHSGVTLFQLCVCVTFLDHLTTTLPRSSAILGRSVSSRSSRLPDIGEGYNELNCTSTFNTI